MYAYSLKEVIIDFETDVSELTKIQRFRKLDGEPATVGKLQVNPIMRVLRNVTSVLHLMHSYEAALSEWSSQHLAQFLAQAKVKAAMEKLENMKALLGQAKGFLSRSF